MVHVTSMTDGVSFFYPSCGVSALLDKSIDFGKNVDLFKLHATYSIVGNDVPIGVTNELYNFGETAGSITPPESSSFRTLKPEKTNSLEVGFDGTFFQNRFNVNLTYYKTNTKNQYFPNRVNLSNGTIDTDEQIRRLIYSDNEINTNNAELQKGIELLNQENSSSKFTGDIGGTRVWWDKANVGNF